MTVADWVSGAPGEDFDLALPLAPGACWDVDMLTLPGGAQVRLQMSGRPGVVCGSTEPYAGWWSDTYGQAVPAVRLEMSGTIDGPVWWTVGSQDVPRTRADRQSLNLGGLEVKVEWGDEHVRLVVTEGKLEHLALLPTTA